MTDTARDLIQRMADLADALDGRKRLVSSQGQALDGFTALANFKAIADEARDFLAQSKPEGPTDEELNAMLYYEFTTSTGHGERSDPIGFARAVLARWGRSVIEPAQESEGQPLARVEFAKQDFNGPSDVVLAKYCDDWFYGDPERTEVDPVDLCRGAIRLFAQPLAPVPVSERLPGSEDCDAKGCCWVHDSHGQWFLIHHRAVKLSSWGFSHWLPHWALPKPQKGGDND